MNEIYERQAVIIQLTHTDGKTLEPVTPLNVTWSLHDARSGTAIREDQVISSPVSHIVDVEIQSVDNAIKDNGNQEEEKTLSVRSEFSGSSFATLEYEYRVKNMGFWTPS